MFTEEELQSDIELNKRKIAECQKKLSVLYSKKSETEEELKGNNFLLKEVHSARQKTLKDYQEVKAAPIVQISVAHSLEQFLRSMDAEEEHFSSIISTLSAELKNTCGIIDQYEKFSNAFVAANKRLQELLEFDRSRKIILWTGRKSKPL